MVEDTIIFITGAGISAPSGIPTFRSEDGLWSQYPIEKVATKAALDKDPKYVIEFWNKIRSEMFVANPNDAHFAITRLQEKYNVIVITQNIDDLHERAGNTNVIHLHGDINYVRPLVESGEWYDEPTNTFIGNADIPEGMRPSIVLFDEDIENFKEAKLATKSDDVCKVVVIGTSLDVYPASSLVKFPPFSSDKHIIDLNPKHIFGYTKHCGNAELILPRLVDEWLK
jgi:NAD-dependent deacetylase